MEFICQLGGGYMLVRYSTGRLGTYYTGYPYPDTEKSNIHALQELLGAEEGSSLYVDIDANPKKYMESIETSIVRARDDNDKVVCYRVGEIGAYMLLRIKHVFNNLVWVEQYGLGNDGRVNSFSVKGSINYGISACLVKDFLAVEDGYILIHKASQYMGCYELVSCGLGCADEIMLKGMRKNHIDLMMFGIDDAVLIDRGLNDEGVLHGMLFRKLAHYLKKRYRVEMDFMIAFKQFNVLWANAMEGIAYEDISTGVVRKVDKIICNGIIDDVIYFDMRTRPNTYISYDASSGRIKYLKGLGLLYNTHMSSNTIFSVVNNVLIEKLVSFGFVIDKEAIKGAVMWSVCELVFRSGSGLGLLKGAVFEWCGFDFRVKL